MSCHTADSKPVKQEVNGTVILPPLSIPCAISGRMMISYEENFFTKMEDPNSLEADKLQKVG